jgi:general secretion pathway protein E
MGWFDGKQKHAVLLDNGIYDMRRFAFSGRAALHHSGQCYVATGYRHNEDFLTELKTHQDKGLLPQVTSYETRTLEQIADFYEGSSRASARAASDDSRTSGERRLMEVITTAAAMKASDIRIIIHDTYTAVRLRVAGSELDYGHRWTPEEGEVAISAASAQQDDGGANVDRQRGEFQSFSLSPKDEFPLPRDVVKLRVQIGFHESDTKLGSYLVARLFYNNSKETGTLEDLGLDGAVLDALGRVRDNLKGCVLIGGETGDGKSTTLVRALEKTYDDHDGKISIVTLEDPVEYKIRRAGVMQIPLKSAGDDATRSANYRKFLRNFVRINPDLAMIAELGDGVAAQMALQFASSGHGLYSTIHVDGANGILFRMSALGVPVEELCQTGIIRLLLKQTLARILCDDCKIPLSEVVLTPQQARKLAPLKSEYSGIFLKNPKGCAICCGDFKSDEGSVAWAGIKRMMAVAEFIEPDDAYNSFVRNLDANGAKNYWLTPKISAGMGGIELAQKTTELVFQGQLDPFDCLHRKGDLSKQLSASQRAELIWSITA